MPRLIGSHLDIRRLNCAMWVKDFYLVLHPKYYESLLLPFRQNFSSFIISQLRFNFSHSIDIHANSKGQGNFSQDLLLYFSRTQRISLIMSTVTRQYGSNKTLDGLIFEPVLFSYS